jgi:glyceraldehyde 3-phosphate dehydrogenase
VAINGFGRIGRVFTRLALAQPQAIEIVAINDTGPAASLSHLLRFDSIHGTWHRNVSLEGGTLVIGAFGESQQVCIPLYAEGNPERLTWIDVQPDVVLESTGRFKTADALRAHLQAGAPRVLLTAVPSGDGVKTIVMGANEHLVDGTETMLSNASCTTNCAAPLVDVIDKAFHIESGYITTVHSYTGDQSLHDRPHSDLRRARAAALSMIPTTTGAAKAITRIFPALEGRLGGAGIRVPVPNGSITDVTYILRNKTTIAEVNAAFAEAARKGPWQHILEYTDLPLVSSDIVGNTHSCVFDSQLTSVLGNMVKVVGWYDNEMGYSARLIDLLQYWSKWWSGLQNAPA